MDATEPPRLPLELWAAIIEHLPRISDVAALGIALPGALLRPLVDEICARPMVRAPNRLLASGAPLPIVQRLLAHWRTRVRVPALRLAIAGGRLEVLAWLIDLLVHTDDSTDRAHRAMLGGLLAMNIVRLPASHGQPARDGTLVLNGVHYRPAPACAVVQGLEHAIVDAMSVDRVDMVSLMVDALGRYPTMPVKRRVFVRLMKSAVEQCHLPSIEALHTRGMPSGRCECPHQVSSHAIKHDKVDALRWMRAWGCAATQTPPRAVECALRHNATGALEWAADLLCDPQWRIHRKCVTEALERGNCAEALARACALGLVDARANFALAVLTDSVTMVCDVRGRPTDRHAVSYSSLCTPTEPRCGQLFVYRTADGLVMGRTGDFWTCKGSRLVVIVGEADPIPRLRFGPIVIQTCLLVNVCGHATLTFTMGGGGRTMALGVCAENGPPPRRPLVLTPLGNGADLIAWIWGRSPLVGTQ
ncbi:hypothetical protein pqer_cds_744 [Pandoravirus quercus]|uniref:Uncharacterized protein n=1 Tax=Pandoravirus quercus TaxID=2107709 RepID=A0A2U7U9Q9_9VIRU|nr:hypothetical protein pqer_cds_744 [Pandoravirus quercus]AVK75166.1 hypothetical protein pqer_cds_744 [Pandoravirus quercus]